MRVTCHGPGVGEEVVHMVSRWQHGSYLSPRDAAVGGHL